MELIIIRHGETMANLRQVIQGQTQGNLSPKGRSQAHDIAAKLRDKRIDVVFSSDLRRASDTAYEIARQHDVPVYHIKWLRGRDSGRYEGKKWDDVVSKIGHEKAFKDIHFKFGGGESMIEMRKRIAKFVKAVKKAHPDDTVLICTHRHCVSVLLGVIFDIPLDEMLGKLEGIKNAQIIGNAEDVRIKIDGERTRYLGRNRNVLSIISAAHVPNLYIS